MLRLRVTGVLILLSLAQAQQTQKESQEEAIKKRDLRHSKCRELNCGPGRECIWDPKAEDASCVCRKECPAQQEPRAKVCSNHNVTFSSECELYKQQCLCEKELEGCQDQKYEHAWVDYFGHCTEFKPCSDWEMKEYPRRMREWLSNIMQELAQRNGLSTGAGKLAEESRKQPKHWVLPVIWKFCDLDISHNKLVSYLELLPMSAPLKAMEHCTQPFLDGCDGDSDGEISLKEWGTCLGLEQDEIQDKCDAIKDN